MIYLKGDNMEEVIKVSNLTRKYKDFSLGPVDL